MKFLSVCSGIEAASTAWESLGWEAVGFSEIEKFPSAVLAHHWPDVPNLGDMTKYNEWKLTSPIGLLVGGTPCQSFSVAGLRKGLQDPRGNLTLTFLGMVEKFQPRWVVWENVPGVLSDRTNAFGQFLAGLGELGYQYAYRVLDAQYFGVPQRRRRVFVVASIGDNHPFKVLFESESLQRDITPSREAGEGSAGYTQAGFGGYREGAGTLRANGGDYGGGTETLIPKWSKQIAPTLNAAFADKMGLEDQHALGGAGHFVPETMGTLTARMFNALGSRDVEEGAVIPIGFDPYNQEETGDKSKTLTARSDMDGPGCVAVPIQNATRGKSQNGIGVGKPDDAMYTLDQASQHAVAFEPGATKRLDRTIKSPYLCPTLRANMGDNQPAVAFDHQAGGKQTTHGASEHHTRTLGTTKTPAIASPSAVRRLTPTECERLQGFPDGHTQIPYRGKPADQCPDGPRYKALGNSMAVPVMAWIGERIAKVEGGQA